KPGGSAYAKGRPTPSQGTPPSVTLPPSAVPLRTTMSCVTSLPSTVTGSIVRTGNVPIPGSPGGRIVRTRKFPGATENAKAFAGHVSTFTGAPNACVARSMGRTRTGEPAGMNPQRLLLPSGPSSSPVSIGSLLGEQDGASG